jgi:hypothetical protein
MDKYLKTKNAPFVWTFLGVNIAVVLAIRITGTADLVSLNAIWSQLTLKDGLRRRPAYTCRHSGWCPG